MTCLQLSRMWSSGCALRFYSLRGLHVTCWPVRLPLIGGFSQKHMVHLASVRKYVHKDQFMNGSSSAYVEEMYRAWQKDPSSVHISWAAYFQRGYTAPPDFNPRVSIMAAGEAAAAAPSAAASASFQDIAIDDHFSVQSIIGSFQSRGHNIAKLDPLGILIHDFDERDTSDHGPKKMTYSKELQLNVLNFMKQKDIMERSFKLPPGTYIGGKNQELPLREILTRLHNIYCGSIGVEFMYMNSIEQSNWIKERMETPGVMAQSVDDKKLLLNRVARATGFEMFLAKKWASEKRFGLEGCETMIPIMKKIIDVATETGVESVIIGMPHRGRLNVLANICRKPLVQIFSQFYGLEAADEGSGDVKYHLGTVTDRLNRATNKNVRIAVVANPSHLECVAPVVQGKARAELFYKGDTSGKTVLTMLLHGDAAFCGQGIVYETIHLSDLPKYTVHGSIHIVANNQVGFTTDPRHSRSSTYCTDVGRVVNAPIFHVNSDDPEACMYVAKLAAEFRATFHRDVVIDIVGYRRNGHNEIDEPMFTQPRMYNRIRETPPVLQIYSKQLVDEKVVTEAEVKSIIDEYDKICESEFEASRKVTHIQYKDWIDSPWSGFFKGKDPLKMSPTGISEAIMKTIADKFSAPPKDFSIHKGIDRILKARGELATARSADWAMGEAFAIGSLLKEGFHVRLSGEDVERGTFSHRHHVLHDQVVDKKTYNMLHNIWPEQAFYSVTNSALSEYGVLGFDVGFSISNPNALCIWEAQFGDFNNVAQCIIDQFISSGQAKWVRQSGLVMLQPHGLEGMGPEHSSARLERFLQMSAEDPDNTLPFNEQFVIKQLYDINWIVANCTTPANLFHIWRRQCLLPFRKPLILMSPKSLLRHPDARSSWDEMGENTNFQRIIPDDGEAGKNPGGVKKLVFCCGKVYYDLKKAREDKKLNSQIAIVRVEQLTPFPFDLVAQEVEKYSEAAVCWSQEEHKNQGAWYYVQPRICSAIKASKVVTYAGRPVAASPATGSKPQHYKEVKNLLDDTLAI